MAVYNQPEIIFKDQGHVVIAKPAGMVCHQTLDPSRPHLEKWLHENGFPSAKILHRLDKETSGLLIASLNSAAHQDLQEQLLGGLITKKYVAICEPTRTDLYDCPTPVLFEKFKIKPHVEFSYSNYLKPFKEKKFELMRKVNSGGQRAETLFTCLKAEKDKQTGSYYLVFLCQLVTGRKHQIRSHLLDFGTPIVGDSLYNPKGANPGRMLLHAYQLVYRCPQTNQQQRLTLSPSKEFAPYCEGLDFCKESDLNSD